VNVVRLTPGTRVRIEQTILYRDRRWSRESVGVVRAVRREPTGSWFAHGKHGRLWLCRIDLQKDDGEWTKIILDDHTRVTILPSDHETTVA
jgi:hypothetical protein